MFPFECGPTLRQDDRCAGERVDYELDPAEVHAVYPAGRRPSAKVRGFSDYLATQLAGSK